MRVCLVSREYPPDSGWGGIATYTYHQAHGLVELGHDVEVIALSGNANPSATRVEDGVLVHRVQPDGWIDDLSMIRASIPFSQYVLKSALALAQKFFEVNELKPFDVVEAPEHLAEGLGLALKRTTPLVIRLHTPQSKLIEERFHNLQPSFDQQFVAAIERVPMLSCDVITSPSEDMASYVAGDIGVALDQISIVRNPVDVDAFSPEGTKIDLRAKQTVLFVGRLEERKGIRYLVEAVPQVRKVHPQVKFIVVGADTNNAPGQRSALSEMQVMLSDHGQSDAVEFVAHVPLNEVASYYRSADLCVIPSLYDNAPCTCLEAMSSGKAIVATSAGGTAEYVIDNQCGIIVPPRDATALANAIISLLSDDSKRNTFGANGRQRAVANFHRRVIAENSVPEYQRAIDNFAGPTAPGLYRKDPDGLFAAMKLLMQAYDANLYNTLYAQSAEFRLKHRVRKAFSMLGSKCGRS